MAKKKAKNAISNYRYSIKKNKDKLYVRVVCSFTYEGTRVKHTLVLPRVSGKKEEAYIEDAKAQIKTLQANDKLKDIAKEYALKHKKGNFFKRHKVPVIVCSSVLLAGAIAGGSFALYKTFNKSLTQAEKDKLVENQIDEYLSLPTDVAGKTVFVEEGAKRMKTVLENLSDNLTNIQAKQLSSNFDISLFGSRLDSMGGLGKLSSAINDTTEFYSDKEFRTKNLSNVELNCSWFNNGVVTEDVKKTQSYYNNGVEYSEDSESKAILKYDSYEKGGEKLYSPFFHQEITIDGYSAKNLNGDYFYEYEDKTDEEAIESVNDTAGNIVDSLANIRDARENMDALKQYDDKNMYLYIPSSPQQVSYLTSIYSLTDIPVYAYTLTTWHFVKTDDLGWVLKSFACDGLDLLSTINGGSLIMKNGAALYVRQNDHGVALDTPLCVGKCKGYVEFDYGERTADKKYTNLKYDDTSNPMTINYDGGVCLDFYSVSDSTQNEKQITPLHYCPSFENLTIVKRYLDSEFVGYSFSTMLPKYEFSDFFEEGEDVEISINLCWYETIQDSEDPTITYQVPHRKKVGWGTGVEVSGGIKGENFLYYETEEDEEAETNKKYVDLIQLVDQDSGSYLVNLEFNRDSEVSKIVISSVK